MDWMSDIMYSSIVESVNNFYTRHTPCAVRPRAETRGELTTPTVYVCSEVSCVRFEAARSRKRKSLVALSKKSTHTQQHTA